MASQTLLAVGGAEGAQLNGSLGGHHLGRPVRRYVDALGLLLLDLLLDPEVGKPQPILQMNLQTHQISFHPSSSYIYVRKYMVYSFGDPLHARFFVTIMWSRPQHEDESCGHGFAWPAGPA